MLLAKGSASDKDTRQWAELTAAGLTTAAAGFELAAMSVGSVAARYGAHTVAGRGARIALGGLKLAGGGLATIGGGILVALDVAEVRRAFAQGKSTLGLAYVAHAVVAMGITGISASISLSTSGPLLRWILLNTERQLLRAALPVLIRQAESLAAVHISALLGLALGWSTAIGLLITAAIWVLEPDEMETWCVHCCFGSRSQDSFAKPFVDEATELRKLYEALRTVS